MDKNNKNGTRRRRAAHCPHACRRARGTTVPPTSPCGVDHPIGGGDDDDDGSELLLLRLRLSTTLAEEIREREREREGEREGEGGMERGADM